MSKDIPYTTSSMPPERLEELLSDSRDADLAGLARKVDEIGDLIARLSDFVETLLVLVGALTAESGGCTRREDSA